MKVPSQIHKDGRIIIPKLVRQILNITGLTNVTIDVENEQIIIKVKKEN